MSNGGIDTDSFLVWVGDLDDYIDIYEHDRLEAEEARKDARREEAEKLREDFDAIGKIPLLDDKVISPQLLRAKQIDISDWRWALHQAETSLSGFSSGSRLEQRLVRSLVSLGRQYSLARYAKLEGVPYKSALTASLPFGLAALITQYLRSQGLYQADETRDRIRDCLSFAANLSGTISYGRTGLVQSSIHSIALDAFGPDGPKALEREKTRAILSLARLHFSYSEIDFQNFTDIRKLSDQYKEARVEENPKLKSKFIAGESIRNWRIRHVRPLTDLFPFAIRFALKRGISHTASNAEVPRTVAINELALAHCGIQLMRRQAKYRRNR